MIKVKPDDYWLVATLIVWLFYGGFALGRGLDGDWLDSLAAFALGIGLAKLILLVIG